MNSLSKATITITLAFVMLVSGHCHRVGKNDDVTAHHAPRQKATTIDTFNALLSQAKANSTATTAHFRAEIRALKAGQTQNKIYKMDRNPEGIWEYYPANIHNQNIQK